MSYQSEEFVRQQAIQSRCFHPTGKWEEFPDSALHESIVARFEQIAARYPDRVAVKMADEELSYAALNRAADRVAHAILARRGSVEEPIAIVMRLQIKALIAILGILKAGKFYTVPDLLHPPDRLKLMLQNAQAPLLLTDNRHLSLAQSLNDAGCTILNLDSFDSDLSQTQVDDSNPGLPLTPDSLFFITYTSGTTGQPKGIYSNQRAFMQRIQRFVNHIHFAAQDRIAFTQYPGFTPRFFSPLLVGSTVFLFDLRRSDVAQLIDWLRQERITLMGLSVAALRRVLNTLDTPGHLSNLRAVIAGSEALQKTDLALFQQRCTPDCYLLGSYGMTEALGGFQSFWMDQQTTIEGDRIPAGYSQDGFEVLIHDEAGNQEPPNTIGEIVLQSRYLSLGYWRQPELTASRFCPHPTESHQQLYFTGDRGFLQPDGCLVHLGRKDDQLKIRGYLVEPIEVERALLSLGYYREAAVGARSNRHSEAMLVAWLVAGPATPSFSVVRRQLALTLPDYMIPAAFVMLDQLPLTPANKVDRKALPAPSLHRPDLSTRYRLPSDRLENWLVACWEDVLGIQPIGVDDNFFDLGGDSLQAMRIISRLRAEINQAIYVTTIFNAPTIADFTTYLKTTYGATIHRHFAVELTQVCDGQPSASDSSDLIRTAEKIAQLRQLFQSSTERHARATPVSDKNPSAIFVLASGRSGTTLLRVMLGGHPQLFAPPELYLLEYATVRQWRASIDGGKGYRVEGVLQALMQIRGYGLSGAEQELAGYLEADISTQRLYRILQQAIAPRCFVDKTPSYAHSLDTLRRAEIEFHEARYIHLVRHPQAVIHSFVAGHFGQLSGLQKKLDVSEQQYAEYNWLIAQQNVLEFQQEIPTQRWHRLQYETLVKQPRSTAEHICDFLGLPFHEAMLQPYDDPKQRMTDSIHALTSMAGDPKFHTHSAIDPATADRWREESTEDTLSEETWELAERLGYQQTNFPSAIAKHAASGEGVSDYKLEQFLTTLESISEAQAEQSISQKREPYEYA